MFCSHSSVLPVIAVYIEKGIFCVGMLSCLTSPLISLGPRDY